MSDPTSTQENMLTALPGRVIYFNGLAHDPSGSLVCKLYANYYTIREILFGESATRTLSNLYNLHAVRGVLTKDGLDFKSSMTGPHHYGGFIYPTESYIINSTTMTYHQVNKQRTPQLLHKLPNEFKKRIERYTWKSGRLFKNLINVDTGLQVLSKDSLFDNPGLLLLPEKTLQLNLVNEPHLYDLSEYRAQVVKNDVPWAFHQPTITQNKHAQHKLRIVTYNYSDDYVSKYLMKGSGIFIERHEFIQAITPMNEQCGGFVIIGKEENGVLELVGIKGPFGYTLLVESGCIHGDSTLTGLYMMAMTGNHIAMATADTVFMKTIENENVSVEPEQSIQKVKGMSGANFLVSSNEKSLPILKNEVKTLVNRISSEKPWYTSFVFNPCVFASTWGPKTYNVPL